MTDLQKLASFCKHMRGTYEYDDNSGSIRLTNWGKSNGKYLCAEECLKKLKSDYIEQYRIWHANRFPGTRNR